MCRPRATIAAPATDVHVVYEVGFHLGAIKWEKKMEEGISFGQSGHA
jgi:hypothetical protein